MNNESASSASSAVNVRAISTVGVVGAGTMGHGIAQVFAQAGFAVQLVDVAQPMLDRARSAIEKSFGKFVEKGTLTADDRDRAIGRLSTTTRLEQLAAADYVVEAILEDVAAKQTLLSSLDRICAPHTILASNTSSISITVLGAATKRPEQVLGMHFMNPVPLMPLVEVIRGVVTSSATYQVTRGLALTLKKTPVEVNDSPGFVSNRVLMPMINEAAFTLLEGVGSAEAIDTVMKLGMSHPIGPLALADLIGLDVCLDILHVLYDGFKDSKYRPCPLFQRMVDAGYLGRKSGRGFYEYEKT